MTEILSYIIAGSVGACLYDAARRVLGWWRLRQERREQRRFDAMTDAERFRAGWDNIRATFEDERWIKVKDTP